jgi:predicted deacylase
MLIAVNSLGPIPLASAGERRTGYFTFAADPTLARYAWPFFSITGNNEGPTFLLTAGIHAAEYTGIDAAIRLGHLLEPAHVRGRVVIIPLLNRPGFYERSIYVNPEDNDNMNRVFPGRPDGTWSERFAHWLLNEVIAPCEYAVDLHAGDMIEDLIPFVIYRETGDERVDGRTRRMIDAYGAEWVVKAMPTGERPGTLYAAASARGVAAMIAESGRIGQVEPDAVARHVGGVQNILRAVGVLDGDPADVPRPRLLTRFEWLRSPVEGFFRCGVDVGARVRSGQALGDMVDLLGEPLGRIESPVDGIVLFLVTSPAIKKDGLLLGVGVPE